MNTSRRRVEHHKRALSIELLEQRTLLTTNLVDGVLTVVGTSRADTIDVAMEVGGAGENLLSVTVNSVKTSFDAALVNALHINALGKNDLVSIADDVVVDATIQGGRGHDSIDGGAGDDELHGDQGNDSVDGDGGHDTVYGEAGTDVLTGDDGDDYVDGGRGNDECFGGLDDDLIHGGAGTDHLDGEDGNDLLDSDGGSDVLEDGLSVDLDIELTANLSGSTGAIGHAELEMEHEDDSLEVEFEVGIAGATPNAVFDVAIDGIIVGQITTDASGNGELNLSNDPDGPNELGLQETFPVVGAGSTITISNETGIVVEGTFAGNKVSDGGSDCDASSDGAADDGGSDGDFDAVFAGLSDGGSDALPDADSDEGCPASPVQ